MFKFLGVILPIIFLHIFRMLVLNHFYFYSTFSFIISATQIHKFFKSLKVQNKNLREFTISVLVIFYQVA